MSGSESADDDGYIRGAGAVHIAGRRVGGVLAVGLLIAIAAVTTVLTIAAIEQNSRLERLQDHGRTVNVTVTSCLGLASGTGITESGYVCKATFGLDGRSYTEVIRGTHELYPIGQTLPGLVLAGDPASLSTVESVAAAHPSWRAFLVPAILGLVLVVSVAALGFRSRLRRPSRERYRPAPAH